MIPLATLAAGGQLAGGILGGASRKKAAKKALADVRAVTDEAVRGVEQDNQQLYLNRVSDEARLKAATGYDLQKLRSDAEAAGFNPLTVLQATGAAGYDGRGAVLQTPFESRADVFMERARLVSAAATGVAATAGYIGDAISRASSAFVDQRNVDNQLTADYYRINKQYEADMSMSHAMGGAGPFGGAVVTGTNGPLDVIGGADGVRQTYRDPRLPEWLNTLVYGDPAVVRRSNAKTMENQGFFHGVADEAIQVWEDLQTLSARQTARDVAAAAERVETPFASSSAVDAWSGYWRTFSDWARGYPLPAK